MINTDLFDLLYTALISYKESHPEDIRADNDIMFDLITQANEGLLVLEVDGSLTIIQMYFENCANMEDRIRKTAIDVVRLFNSRYN